MKRISILLFLFISLSAFSQDPYLQKPNDQAEEQAAEITENYDLQLSLTGKQKLLFQQKVAEFLIRRNKIEATLSGKEKLDALYSLQQEETAEMNDVITQPQMAVYRRVKPKIQPLETTRKE